LARSGSGHAAHPYQRVIAESTHNHSPFIQAAQDWPKKPHKRTGALLGIFYAECANVDRILAHIKTNHSDRLIKVTDLQMPQRLTNKRSPGNP
jgi:hypothetical protein